MVFYFSIFQYRNNIDAALGEALRKRRKLSDEKTTPYCSLLRLQSASFCPPPFILPPNSANLTFIREIISSVFRMGCIRGEEEGERECGTRLL